MPINQPANQIKLTNVSVVRLKKGGKRFEIACYKNKVREWRTGDEKDLDEVVQIENVFLNVSKGQVAPAEDLQKAFGTTDRAKITSEILKRGELQVGDKERSAELSSLWKDIAVQVSTRCVDPRTQRPYTTGVIEKAMAEVHYSVRATKPAKSQALDVIRLLQAAHEAHAKDPKAAPAAGLPLQRARMRVRITMPAKEGKRLKEKVLAEVEKVEEDDWADEWELIATIDPGALRVLNDLLEVETKGRGKVETMSFATVQEGDADADRD